MDNKSQDLVDEILRLPSAERLDGKIGHTVLYAWETDSTNRLLERLARKGLPHGVIAVADRQTAGRGKGERVWHGTPEDSLCFSILLRDHYNVETLPQITLVAAVAMVDAIWQQTGLRLQIKWPNDVLASGRKVSGILTECCLTPEGEVDYIIVGIGLNVNNEADDFPNELKDMASSLNIEVGYKLDRINIIRAISERMEYWVNIWCTQGFLPVRDAWTEHSHTLGKFISLHIAEATVTGQAIGLECDGSLLLRDEHGNVHAFYSGETSMPESVAAPATN